MAAEVHLGWIARCICKKIGEYGHRANLSKWFDSRNERQHM